MAKFCGIVGYLANIETAPGVWTTPEPLERKYYGDVLKKSSRWDNGISVNDNINVTNEISIIADPYAYQHFSEMKYVIFEGVKWTISSITVERPRITLSLGGIYNG